MHKDLITFFQPTNETKKPDAGFFVAIYSLTLWNINHLIEPNQDVGVCVYVCTVMIFIYIGKTSTRIALITEQTECGKWKGNNTDE